MPVEDPPTSTAIPLRPSAAARTTRAQLRVVFARHVHRQRRQPGLWVVGLDRPVHLQGERVSHLGQRTCSRPPSPRAPARAGQLAQRAFHQLPERVRAREGPRGQAAVLDPAAERVLPVPELAVDQRRRRDTRSSASVSSRNTSRSRPASVAVSNSSSV